MGGQNRWLFPRCFHHTQSLRGATVGRSNPRRRHRSRPADLPAKFDQGFLAKVDKRFRPALNVAATIERLQTALAEELSPQQKIVVQRIAWSHQRLQELESEYAKGLGFDAQTWVALTTTLYAGLKLIGLARRAKALPRAIEYAATASANGHEAPSP
jgi:hypothetical protein